MKHWQWCLVAALGYGIANAQNLELEDESSGGATLSLSANGTCWNDCWVDVSPQANGTLLAIMKDDSVADLGFVSYPMNELPDGDAPNPPSDGFGSVSQNFNGFGVNGNGQTGMWSVTITWTFVDFQLRDVRTETTFTPIDPPPDDGEGSGNNGGSGG